VPIVGVVFIFIDLTLDSTPDINMYGDSLKYPHVKKFTLSPEDIAISKKSKETTPPTDDTETETEPKESAENIETETESKTEDEDTI
jgi:hypothetical protein